MKKTKTYKHIIICSILTLSIALLFSVSINATGTLEGSDIYEGVQCDVIPIEFTGYANNYIDGVLLDSGNYQTYVFYVNSQNVYNSLNTVDFKQSSVFAIDFLNISPQTNSGLSEIYSSNVTYTNLDSVYLTINTIGDVIQSQYLTELSNTALTNENATLTAENTALTYENATLTAENSALRDSNSQAYDKGYNEAISDNNAIQTGFTTIFSSPMYVFGEVFNFELFGFSFLTIIQVLLSIALIAFVLKKIR